MNILFENRYTSEKKYILESSNLITRGKFRKIFSLAIFILIVASLSIRIYSYGFASIFSEKNITSFIFIYILGLSISPVLFFYEYIMTSYMLKAAKTIQNGVIAESVVKFTDENILIEEGNINISIVYSQIKNIKETKHLYILMLGKMQSIILCKNNFSVGTLDNFKIFIKTKCLGIKK